MDRFYFDLLVICMYFIFLALNCLLLFCFTIISYFNCKKNKNRKNCHFCQKDLVWEGHLTVCPFFKIKHFTLYIWTSQATGNFRLQPILVITVWHQHTNNGKYYNFKSNLLKFKLFWKFNLTNIVVAAVRHHLNQCNKFRHQHWGAILALFSI